MKNLFQALLALTMLTISNSSLANEKVSPEPSDTVLKRHKVMGMMTLPLLGLQVGTGLGMNSYSSAVRPPQTLRAVHLIGSVGLLGASLWQLKDGPNLSKTFKSKTAHPHAAYTYLGALAATAIVGILRVHAYKQGSGPSKTLKQVHTGLGTTTAALGITAVLFAPF